MAADELTPGSGKYSPLPKSRRRGIGLCLSGGGFRATLFHLGALRRLNELGVLTRDDFRTVAAVSGGSIVAAHLATVLARLARPAPGTAIPTDLWDREVRDPLRAFTRRDHRTGPFLRRFVPWRIWRTETTIEALARRYEKDLTALRLADLPERPEFLFLATDMAYGVSFEFSRSRMGDWQAGYMDTPPDFPLARAVAASSCFPPLFGPLRLHFEPGALTGGSAPRGPERDACLSDFRLTDGGNYDNMGLEPVWKDHAIVLVSDAGGLFTNEGDKGLLWRLPRYAGIQERQARALRKRWLIASYVNGTVEGAYWGVGSAASHYDLSYPGYSEAFAREVIAQIRTDLDAFSDAEAAVLENHGYLLVEAAARKHVPEMAGLAPHRVPHPEWLPPLRTEAALRAALADSARRRTWGRG
ncbi:MAG TPA: patatin-like phospholipase family protein [Vicinamibacteria bacterium]|nr:patatin-like phospholipase family protein [Vicinamibacteria bacterium]